MSWEQVTEELKATMEWSESTILVIGHIWKEEGDSIVDIQQRMLNIGQVHYERQGLLITAKKVYRPAINFLEIK